MKITGKKERFYEFLEGLIRIDTTNPPGREREAARYAGRLLEKEGFQVRYEKVGEDRENLVASVGRNSEKEVILTGHLDVVPAGTGWETDPFQMAERQGKILGRGSCDMKGALAAMTEAAVWAARQPDILEKKKITLAFVCDEEVTGSGSRYFVKNHVPAKETLTVIGEPTGLEVQTAHRGTARFLITVRGKQAHAAMPERGVNPIMEMGRFLLAVERFNEERQKKSYGILPFPVITPTIMKSGVKENVIPAECSVLLDCRTVAKETEEMLRGQLTLLFLEARADERALVQIETLLYAPVGLALNNGSCCRTALKVLEGIDKREHQPGCFQGSTDLPIFVEAGYENTILCGPGDMAMAHQSNEYVTVQQLEQAVDFYAEFLKFA